MKTHLRKPLLLRIRNQFWASPRCAGRTAADEAAYFRSHGETPTDKFGRELEAALDKALGPKKDQGDRK